MASSHSNFNLDEMKSSLKKNSKDLDNLTERSFPKNPSGLIDDTIVGEMDAIIDIVANIHSDMQATPEEFMSETEGRTNIEIINSVNESCKYIDKLITNSVNRFPADKQGEARLIFNSIKNNLTKTLEEFPNFCERVKQTHDTASTQRPSLIS